MIAVYSYRRHQQDAGSTGKLQDDSIQKDNYRNRINSFDGGSTRPSGEDGVVLGTVSEVVSGCTSHFKETREGADMVVQECRRVESRFGVGATTRRGVLDAQAEAV